MKGKSIPRRDGRGSLGHADAQDLAVAAFERIAADPDRLGRFLALTGLDPAQIRTAAASPAFLPAVLDHVLADEPLLLAIADEIGRLPEALALAQARLAPIPDEEF